LDPYKENGEEGAGGMKRGSVHRKFGKGGPGKRTVRKGKKKKKEFTDRGGWVRHF